MLPIGCGDPRGIDWRGGPHYAIFACDEGTPEEIEESKRSFNQLVNDAYVMLTRSALMGGFHRPTAGEFRTEFITQCRKYLKQKGFF